MYTVITIFTHTVSTLRAAREMASIASVAYGITVNIFNNKTGEIIATYEHGHPVE